MAILRRRLRRRRRQPKAGLNVQRQRQGRANPSLAKTIGAKDDHLPVLLHCLTPSLRPREWETHHAIATTTASSRRRRLPTTKAADADEPSCNLQHPTRANSGPTNLLSLLLMNTNKHRIQHAHPTCGCSSSTATYSELDSTIMPPHTPTIIHSGRSR